MEALEQLVFMISLPMDSNLFLSREPNLIELKVLLVLRLKKQAPIIPTSNLITTFPCNYSQATHLVNSQLEDSQMGFHQA